VPSGENVVTGSRSTEGSVKVEDKGDSASVWIGRFRKSSVLALLGTSVRNYAFSGPDVTYDKFWMVRIKRRSAANNKKN
jgi:hypothetical protein